MAIRPINGGGTVSAGRQTVLLAGSPFATRAALITASQANPTQLFNNNQQVTIAVVSTDPTPSNNGTFEWTGQTGVYNGDFWVDFNGLDASDIKALYESNPNTNAFTNSQKNSVNSVIGLTAGVIPVAVGGGFANSPITQPSAAGINIDGTIQTTKDTVYVGQALSISEDGLDIRADNIVEGISALPVRTILNSDGTTGANLAVVRANRQTVVIQPSDVQQFTGRLTAWFPVTSTRIVKQLSLRFAQAATGIRLTLRDSADQSQTNGPILFQSHTTYEWQNGAGFSVPASGDFNIDIQNSAKFVQGRFVYAVVEQNTQGTGTQILKGDTLTIGGINQFYPWLQQSFVTESALELASKGDTQQSAVYSFVDASNALSTVAVKALMPTANKVTDWNAQTLNTLTTSYTTTAGAKFVYFAIPSDEQITAAGISVDSGATWVNLTPVFRFFVDYNGFNFAIYTASSAFTFTATPYRLRFTAAQSAAGSGITYTGTTPASQELIIGTGNSSTAQASGITLVGGRIPNTSIGVNSVQLTGAIQLDNQSAWQSYRFRRIQFTGSGNYVRGIQTLPYLMGASAGQRPWLSVGDWVEVMNIGGTGNYNCQIQTHDVGEVLSGSLTGYGPTIPVSQTAVYRITYTGSNNTWLVSLGASGTAGGDPIPQTYWQVQDDGTGIYTSNDIEVRAGSQLLTQPYSSVGSASSINLSTCEFTFTDHVGAAQFFKYLSSDASFPFVSINQAVPSMDATAALNYLDNTVLQLTYVTGKTIQPDGTGLLTQITYISAGIMQCRLVMADVTNIAIGAQIRIGGAQNQLNNGDFIIQGFTDFAGYTIVQYANANASTDLNAGDTLTTVAFAAPVLFWRTVLASQGSQWSARCQFGLNATFTILAELDPNWFTSGAGHVSWLDDVYQSVVASGGGNIHADSDIHAAGVVSGANMQLAGRNLSNATGPSTQGDSIFYNSATGLWNVGAPRVCQLPVPQSLLTGANQWQVLTFDGTNMSMQFPRFAGVPTSRLGALQNGDSVRYDSTAQTWYNSRTAGSCFARRNSANQSIANLTDVRVVFDTGDSYLGFNSGDTGFTYDGTTNVGRFTNSSGRRVLVNVTYQVPWAANASGIRFTWIRINGIVGNRVGYVGTMGVQFGDITCNNGAATFALDNNQYFEVWCYQSSGAALNIGNVGGGIDTGFGTRIQITRVNP